MMKKESSVESFLEEGCFDSLSQCSKRCKNYEGDLALGIGILHAAIKAPMRSIAENAGVNGDVVIHSVRQMMN